METDNIKDPKNYELAILLKSEEQVTEMSAYLGQHQATLSGEPKVKKLALAYPVKKEKEAIFVSYLFSAIPTDAKKLEQDLAVRTDVLRSMIIIAVPAEEGRVSMGDAPFARRRSMSPRTNTRPAAAPAVPSAPRPAPSPAHLTNDALEKKIEEILQ